MRFTTSTKALREALTATVPVAGQADTFARVRFEVREHTMLISATDGFAAIITEVGVDIWDGHPGGAPVLELAVGDAKKILDVHRMPKGDGVTPDDVQLTITVTDESWRSEDSSGLFASAEALEMPLAPKETRSADLAGVFGERVHRWLEQAGGAETLTFDHAPVTLSLAPFDKARKTYAEPMVVRLTADRRAALVTIGSDVLGMAVTKDITSEVERVHGGGADWLAAWERWSLVLPEEPRGDLHIAGPNERLVENEDDEPDDGEADDSGDSS